MKKLALLFPGQGSQHIGMGRDLCTYFPVANRTFEEAADMLKQDLKRLCFEGDIQELTRTDNAQPAILTVSVAKFRVYQQELDITPTLGAGHSLGEYSALVCSGAISFREALKLVKARGRIMQEASGTDSGGMAAVTGLHRNAVEAECKAFESENHCVTVANYNAAIQTVISGHKEALEQVGERLTAKGGRVVPLKVSAAFHSPLMQPCAERFEQELAKYTFKTPRWPVISNVDTLPYKEGREIPLKLKLQITHPIRWMETMEYMKKQGIDVAIELGPKKILKNLMKRSSREIKVYSANTQADLQELYEIDPDDFIDKRPNMLERCLAMAVSTANRNFDEDAYQSGVIVPYRKIKEMYYTLAEEKQEPGPRQVEEALTLLKTIFDTKRVPEEEQKRRFERIHSDTDETYIQEKHT
jgi:[acyl-carrier-protein] S-malonyltransferase